VSARPGGNVTGVALHAGAEFAGKWVELLKAAVPQVSHVAFLYHEATIPVILRHAHDLHLTTHALGLRMQPLEVQELDQSDGRCIRHTQQEGRQRTDRPRGTPLLTTSQSDPRAGHQPQNGSSPRFDDPTDASLPSGRADSVRHSQKAAQAQQRGGPLQCLPTPRAFRLTSGRGWSIDTPSRMHTSMARAEVRLARCPAMYPVSAERGGARMHCPLCYHENRGGSCFRPVCRQSVAFMSPACGKPPLPRAVFCNHRGPRNWIDNCYRIPLAGTSTVDASGIPPAHLIEKLLASCAVPGGNTHRARRCSPWQNKAQAVLPCQRSARAGLLSKASTCVPASFQGAVVKHTGCICA
jgi:hypothetical protein